tara:strand:- start:1230 stop:1343 length:114 start_codon:yes stop_codon:yes gene_type:complete
VGMKKESFVQLVMQDSGLSLMAKELKLTSAYFVIDET